jgi:hypothetical protein
LGRFVVRVPHRALRGPSLDGSRFKLEQDEELKFGGTLHEFSMVYKVKAIRPLSVEESDEFDAIAELDWLAVSAQFGRDRPA